METWQVLEKAAALIEERGWTKGALEVESGKVCVLGAIGIVLDGRNSDGSLCYFEIGRSPAVHALADALGRPCRFPEMPVWGWNDAAADASDVVDTLRRVAQAEWERGAAIRLIRELEDEQGVGRG